MATAAGLNQTTEQEISIKLAKQLIACLQEKTRKAADKYEYYNADNDVKDFGISTPIKMCHHRPGIGWASRAVIQFYMELHLDLMW